MLQSVQNLRHPRPADAEVTGERRPVLELAGVEQRLVMTGKFHPIRSFFRDWSGFGFLGEIGSPREKDDNRRSA